MKHIIILTIFFISTLTANSQCVYQVCLEDDFGDGWNGNTIDVFVNGALVGNYGATFTTGFGPVCFGINVNNGDDIDIIFNATGSWTSECHFQLTDPLNNVVGIGDDITNIMNVIAVCPCGPNAIDPDPIATINCDGGSDTINFTPIGSCPGTFECQVLDGATVVQPWSTNFSYIATPPATTTFTVETRCSTCPGTIVSDTFRVEIIPPPTITGVLTLCAGDSTTLTASGSTGDFEWWTDEIGGTLLDTSNVLNTSALMDTTTFWTQTSGIASSGGKILITECGLEGFMGGTGSEDYLEISNLYSTPVNTTGWVAAVSDSYSNINLVNPNLWNLPSSFSACDVEWRCDDAGYPGNYWGSNIFWNGTSQSWAIIIDDLGNVVDFVAWGWSAVDLASFNPTINGFSITLGPEWIGNGAALPCSASMTSLQRIGNTDSNTNTDFVCQTSTVDVVNPGLSCGWVPVSCRFPTTVIVNPGPIASIATPDTLNCILSAITLDGSISTTGGNASYLWTTVGGNIVSIDTNATVDVNAPGDYILTITENGCSNSITVTVIQSGAVPTANILPPVLLTCATTTQVLDGSGSSSASGNNGYLWTTVGGNITSATNTATVDIDAPGDYSLLITDITTGCTDSTMVTVLQDIATPSVVIAIPVQLNCITPTQILDGSNSTTNSGTFVYSWSTAGGNIISATNTATAEIDAAGDYTLAITDPVNGCINAVTVTITQDITLPIANGQTTNLCEDVTGGLITADVNLTSLDNSINGGSGYPVSWFTDIALSIPIGNPSNLTTVTQTYYAQVTNPNNGCTNVAIINYVVNPNPQPDFTFNEYCEGTATEFFDNSTSTNLISTWDWDFDDGNTSTLTNPTLLYSNSGTYDVSLTVTDVNGCFETTILPVEAYPNPKADFNMSTSPTSMFDPTINFFDNSTVFSLPVASWVWDIGGLDTSNAPNPTYTFPEDTGHYLITLTITDAKGCENTIMKTAIVYGEYGIYMPNAFTPDGNGENDMLIPKGFGISDDDFSFTIFNRWGEVIFESHNIERGWNGTYKGKKVQTGSYAWRISFKDINGIIHHEMGSAAIIK
jgi:gliding motility-associated-like protein